MNFIQFFEWYGKMKTSLFNPNNCKYTNQSLIYIIFYKIYEIIYNKRKSKKYFFFLGKEFTKTILFLLPITML